MLDAVFQNIVPEQLEKLLNDYTFANRLPREQEIVSALNFKPKILQRKSIIERVADKIIVGIDMHNNCTSLFQLWFR